LLVQTSPPPAPPSTTQTPQLDDMCCTACGFALRRCSSRCTSSDARRAAPPPTLVALHLLRRSSRCTSSNASRAAPPPTLVALHLLQRLKARFPRRQRFVWTSAIYFRLHSCSPRVARCLLQITFPCDDTAPLQSSQTGQPSELVPTATGHRAHLPCYLLELAEGFNASSTGSALSS
jgi:hypothetical protein